MIKWVSNKELLIELSFDKNDDVKGILHAAKEASLFNYKLNVCSKVFSLNKISEHDKKTFIYCLEDSKNRKQVKQLIRINNLRTI